MVVGIRGRKERYRTRRKSFVYSRDYVKIELSK